MNLDSLLIWFNWASYCAANYSDRVTCFKFWGFWYIFSFLFFSLFFFRFFKEFMRERAQYKAYLHKLYMRGQVADEETMSKYKWQPLDDCEEITHTELSERIRQNIDSKGAIGEDYGNK